MTLATCLKPVSFPVPRYEPWPTALVPFVTHRTEPLFFVCTASGSLDILLHWYLKYFLEKSTWHPPWASTVGPVKNDISEKGHLRTKHQKRQLDSKMIDLHIHRQLSKVSGRTDSCLRLILCFFWRGLRKCLFLLSRLCWLLFFLYCGAQCDCPGRRNAESPRERTIHISCQAQIYITNNCTDKHNSRDI